MKRLIGLLSKPGFFHGEIDYVILRAAMVISFYIFGSAKWWPRDVPFRCPTIRSEWLRLWLHPVFGLRGTTWLFGSLEWAIGTLLLLGFLNKRLGLLGAIGSVLTFICGATMTILQPGAWQQSAAGFPDTTTGTQFLLTDLVSLAVSLYLVRQDAVHISARAEAAPPQSRTRKIRLRGFY